MSAPDPRANDGARREPERRRPAGANGDRLGEAVERRARRKLAARGARERNVWFWLGMFGLVGWSVAVPTLLGTALGLWLDRAWPAERASWTLTFLIIGVALGCLNAWYWVRRESDGD
jgi:ATP synthase protein I